VLRGLMLFEWDADKDRINRLKHGVSFAEASAVFSGHTLTVADERHDYGELRYKTIGESCGVILSVIHTPRPPSIRIISARPASRTEREAYHEHCQNQQ
jgi:uncharacterized protein